MKHLEEIFYMSIQETSRELPEKVSASAVVNTQVDLLSDEGIKRVQKKGVDIVVERGFRDEIISAKIPAETVLEVAFFFDKVIRETLIEKGYTFDNSELIQVAKYQTGGQFGRQTKDKMYFYPKFGVIATNVTGVNLDQQFWLTEKNLRSPNHNGYGLDENDLLIRASVDATKPRFFWPIISDLAEQVVGKREFSEEGIKRIIPTTSNVEDIPVAYLSCVNGNQPERLLYIPDSNIVVVANGQFQQLEFDQFERQVLRAFSIL